VASLCASVYDTTPSKIATCENFPPEKKKARLMSPKSNGEVDFEALPGTTIFKASSNIDSNSICLQNKGKVPMLMCVDSSPLVINIGRGDSDDDCRFTERRSSRNFE